MQQGIYDWEQESLSKNARLNGLIRAPYNTGKSQQVAIGLSAYMTTRKHELETLIVSADGGISAKRILSLRALFMSNMYKYWCKENNFNAVELASSSELHSIKLWRNLCRDISSSPNWLILVIWVLALSFFINSRIFLST